MFFMRRGDRVSLSDIAQATVGITSVIIGGLIVHAIGRACLISNIVLNEYIERLEEKIESK